MTRAIVRARRGRCPGGCGRRVEDGGRCRNCQPPNMAPRPPTHHAPSARVLTVMRLAYIAAVRARLMGQVAAV